MAITKKQQKFIQEYVKCFNATKAARKAGYSARSAHVQGCKLLKKPNILAEIDKFKMSSEEIKMRIESIAREGETDATKLRALELAGRATGIFTERVEISGGSKPIKVEYVNDWKPTIED